VLPINSKEIKMLLALAKMTKNPKEQQISLEINLDKCKIKEYRTQLLKDLKVPKEISKLVKKEKDTLLKALQKILI